MFTARSFFAVAFVASSLLTVACSGTEGTGQNTSSGGAASNVGGSSPTGTGATSSSSSGAASLTPEQCVAKCEAAHPMGKSKGALIDQCWVAKCGSSCESLTSDGKNYGPNSGSCQTSVSTPSAACSTCTAQKCCDAWDGCFKDADCAALNECTNQCYAGK